MRGVGVIVLASLLFGAMTVCVRSVAQEMAPLQVTFWRFFGSTLLLLLGSGWTSLRPAAAPMRVLILRGLLGAAAISLWFTGIRDIGAATATLLHSTYPLWATLLSVLVLGERFGWSIGVALGLNLVGIAVVVGPADASRPYAIRGALCSLAAGMFAGAAVATARQLRAQENASVITLWFMVTGTVVTAPSFHCDPSWSPE